MPVYHVGKLKIQSTFLLRAPYFVNPTMRGRQFGELTGATVLFRLKEGVTQAQLATWSQMARDMVGKIPG